MVNLEQSYLASKSVFPSGNYTDDAKPQGVAHPSHSPAPA